MQEPTDRLTATRSTRSGARPGPTPIQTPRDRSILPLHFLLLTHNRPHPTSRFPGDDERPPLRPFTLLDGIFLDVPDRQLHIVQIQIRLPTAPGETLGDPAAPIQEMG